MLKKLVFLLLLIWTSCGAAFGQSLPATQCVSTAIAGGTPDAITIPALPCTATSTLLVLTLTGTNTTTTPTIQMIGVSSPQVILSGLGGNALTIGALQSSSHVLMTYNGLNWFLMTSQQGSPTGVASGDLTGNYPGPQLNNSPTARANLGLGSIATQAASAVAITGGSIALTGLNSFSHTAAFPDLSLVTTPVSFVSQNIGNYPIAGMVPAGVLETNISALVVPNSTPNHVWPQSNYAAYIDNQQTGIGSSTVNYFGFALADGNSNTSSWFLNGVLSNTDPLHTINGANQGKDFSLLVGYEINPNIWTKAAGGTPNGTIEGLRFIGAGNVQPSGGSIGLHFFQFGNGVPWSTALFTDDGSMLAQQTISLGALTTAAASVSSQGIAFRTYDSGASSQVGVITFDSSQRFQVATNASGGMITYANGVSIFTSTASASAFASPLVVGSMTQTVDANAKFLAHITTDENFEVRGHIDNADGVTLQAVNDARNASKSLEIIATTYKLNVSTINFPNIGTGTPAASICLDASNNVIKKTTAGSCI